MKNEKKSVNADKTKNKILTQDISSEMRKSYLDYAMSVITSRALPDVRDGLKPVHRRILYAMHGMGLSSSVKTRKSAAIIGEVLGKYHPHGDAAAYDALVKMAQNFSTRYPLIIGQGNFGSIDGDSPAAMRYTEAKMSKIAGDVISDLEKETVDFKPNYENTRNEPVVLPTLVPNIILNGTLGIAVGMATNIPPNNLSEVIDATIHLVDNKNATTEDLMNFVKGPDFPMGGVAYGRKDIIHAYANGRGGILVRGEADIVEKKPGQFQILITSIPYRVNKSELILKIADLVRSKKIEGIKDLRDESTKDIRIVIDLKSNAQPNKILNTIYKHTQLEDTFHVNIVAIVKGVPQTLSFKSILEEFISHRKEVVKRRTEFELRKAEAREHILIGLKKALDHIDKIIKLIRASKDTPTAHAKLRKEFKFSDVQATAILEMKLQKLAGLERKKIDDELEEKKKLIKSLKEILASTKRMMAVIKKELEIVKEKYGDDRRTKIMINKIKDISAEDMIPDEESVLVYTAGGYVKRTNPDEFKRQRRGGVGVVDINTKEEDFVTKFLTGTTHSNLLFFTDIGKVFQIKMYDLPEGKRATKGKSILNFLSLGEGEKITSILPMPKNTDLDKFSLMMVTKQGVVKKSEAKSFSDVRRSGIIAINLTKEDELVSAAFVKKDDTVMLTTKKGQSIRFKEADVRSMGRTAGGVRAIKVSSNDVVVGVSVIKTDAKNPELLVMSENGYGKKTKIKEYKIQKRGGSGIKTMKITPKTGDLMSSKLVTDELDEIVAMSQKGQVIRVNVDEVPSLGRQTQGVRIMKLRVGDSIASLICL